MKAAVVLERCVYCGRATQVGSLACPAHDDLPDLDERYTLGLEEALLQRVRVVAS